MTLPEQTAANLRQPLNPAHGPYEVYKRVLDAMAVMIEQNEAIADQLRQLNEPARK